ncbi:Serine-threonine protein kinase [Entamoeba marina]
MLLAFFCYVLLTSAEVVNFEETSNENNTWIFNIHFDQTSSIPYNIYLFNKNVNLTSTQFRVSTYLSDFVNSTTIISFTNYLRPIVFCNADTILALNDGILYFIEPVSGEIFKNITNFSDKGSPMAYFQTSYPVVNDVGYIFVCKNDIVAVYTSGYGEVSQKESIPCGMYLVSGDTYFATKKNGTIYVISTDSSRSISVHKKIEMNITDSETYEYDPIVMNIHNTIYSSVTDKNKIIALDNKTNYEKQSILKVPFYTNGTTTFYNSSYATNMATYGSMLIVGCYGNGGNGKIFIYFDNILTGYLPRYELVETREGKKEDSYFGYTVGLSYKNYASGGNVLYNSRISEPDWYSINFNSTNIEKVCDGTVCNCLHDYYWDSKTKTCQKNFKKTWVGLVFGILAIIFVFLLIIGSIVLIGVYIWKRPKDEKSKTYRLGNSNKDFMHSDAFCFKFTTENLTFGSEKGPVKLHEPIQETLVFSNQAKKEYKYHIEAPKTHRMDVNIAHPDGSLKPGFCVEVVIEIIVHCTCRTDEVLEIAAIPSKGTTTYAPIPINVESVVSTQIDYTEVEYGPIIGEGSFGGVFKGTYRGQTVAIKENKTALTQEDKEQFEQEVGMYERIRHECIITFIGSSPVVGNTLMLVEYAPFGSVKNNYLKEDFDLLVGLKVLVDCARGMKFLHGNDIIHRDLKPDNLLLFSFSPKAGVISKISDFGTSKDVLSIKQSAAMTKAIGTPAYMAPEMVSGGEYGLPVDVFSFAIVALEIISKVAPYSNTTLFQHNWDIADFINSGKRLDIPDTIPSTLKEIITESWEQDAEKRIKFDEIEARLNEYLTALLKDSKTSRNNFENIQAEENVDDFGGDGIIQDDQPQIEELTSTNVVSLILDDDNF